MLLPLSALLACSSAPGDIAALGDTDTGSPTADSGAVAPALVINELMAVNQSTITDDAGSYADWIELHNPGDEPASLAGVYLTDEDDEPLQFALPLDQDVDAGDFALFWADARTDQGDDHTNFKLSGTGEYVGLYFAAAGRDVELIDEIEFGVQAPDVSYARVPDGAASWTSSSSPTPGASNGG